MPVIAKALGQSMLEMSAEFLHAVEQPLLADDPLHFERRCAGQRMRHIGVSVLERAGPLPDGIDDAPACEHGADRLIAAA